MLLSPAVPNTASNGWSLSSLALSTELTRAGAQMAIPLGTLVIHLDQEPGNLEPYTAVATVETTAYPYPTTLPWLHALPVPRS